MRNFLFVSLVALLLASCSSGSSPILPDSMNPGQGDPNLTASSQPVETGRMLWGMWECTVDLENETIEAVPLRSAETHFNVVMDMNDNPACVSFEDFSIDKTHNTIGLDVLLYHPYPAKQNLAGFDVHGIMIASGSVTGFNDPSIVMAGPQDPRILNPDGLTRWWNPVEFNHGENIFSYNDGDLGISYEIGQYNATLNGYRVFSDDLGNTEYAGNMNFNDRLSFSTDAVHSRHYEVWFPVNGEKFVIKFNYAIDASWYPIPNYNQGDPVTIPTDFLPQANQEEPFWVVTDIINNSLYFESSSNKGGSALIQVKVFDWQGMLGAGDIANEIAGVMLESPTGYQGLAHGVLIDPGAGSKTFATYEVTLDGANLLDNSGLDGLITVVSAHGDYQPTTTGFSGSAPLAFYKLFTVSNISPTENPENISPEANALMGIESPVTIGTLVSFDATGSHDADGQITDYMWDFDNNGVFGDSYDAGTDAQPWVIFNTPGDYWIDLKVTDNNGASDTLDEKILLTVLDTPNLPPVAIATPDNTDVMVDEVVSFNGTLSYDPDGTITAWEWDFDNDGIFGDVYDGGTDGMPEFSFSSGGDHFVNLQVTDDEGASDTLNEKIMITVTDPQNASPVAVATSNKDESLVGEVISFNGSNSYDPDGTVVSWEWDFDNDGVFGDPYDGGTDQMPQFSFNSGGNYFVNLRVTDNEGVTDTLDEKIFITVADVQNDEPIAIATSNTNNVMVGEVVTFNGSFSYDPDGTVVLWEWDFDNDGIFGDVYGGGTDQKPEYIFSTSGDHYVNLRVTDNEDASDTLDEKILIIVTSTSNQSPVAIATPNKNEAEVGEVVTFNGSYSYDPDGSIVSWEWDFDNDGIFGDTYGGGTDQAPEFSFGAAGGHYVNLRVTDNEGAVDTLNQKILITVTDPQNMAPFAFAYADTYNAEIGEVVTFNGSYSFDPDGTVVAWDWDFNDDGIFGDSYGGGSDQMPQFSFSTQGNHYVDLRVTDNLGAIDTLNQKILIVVSSSQNTPPVAIASADKYVAEVGEIITFDGSASYDSDGTIISWAWDFNDDGIYGDSYTGGSDQEPQLAYPAPGNYFVDLRVTDNDGATDTLDQTIHIVVVAQGDNMPPVAVATVNKTWAWVGQQLIFKGHHSYDVDGYVVSWEWDFDGDGIYGDAYSGGQESKPHVVYEDTGTYYVNLRVTDNEGATDTLETPIAVNIMSPPGQGHWDD